MDAQVTRASAGVFSLSYNTLLVAVGAGLLGLAAGAAGAFLFLRKRALLSDAVAHATLPGVALAFLVMVALGLDGRHLAGLLVGAAATAALGLVCIDGITRYSRLREDAAIGAVLSVFFGFGVVLLTVIQSLESGRQAGLDGLLLGSTASMLFNEALLIAAASGLVLIALYVMRRPLQLVAFDAGYAATIGISVRAMDFALMALVTAVTVIGLKVVGLVLIVALLIIPAVSARFWSNRNVVVVAVSAILGGAAGTVGALISATAPGLPTGPIIVLVSSKLFVVSLVFAPERGLLAALWGHRAFQIRVHRRQGLLAIARGEPILDPLTLAVLRRAGLLRSDGVATQEGRAQAAKARLDEQRWRLARADHRGDDAGTATDGLTPIEEVLTADEVADIDRRLAQLQTVPSGA